MEGNVIDTSKGIMGGRRSKLWVVVLITKMGPDKKILKKVYEKNYGRSCEAIPFVGKFFKGAKTAAPVVEKDAEVSWTATIVIFLI